MTPEVLRSIVLAVCNEICNNHRLSVFDETFAEDYVHIDPALPGIRDRAAFKRALAYVLVAAPGLRVTVEDSFACRAVVIARWQAFCPCRSSLSGSWRGITICHFAGNRITKTWWSYSAASQPALASVLPQAQAHGWWHVRNEHQELTHMNSDDLKTLIRTYTEEVWNQANPSAISLFFTADFVNHDVAAPQVRTLDEFGQWVESILKGFAGLTVTIDSLAADGDICAKRYTLSATHVGPIAGVPPTGKPVRFSGVATYRMRDGKIAECWWNYDFFGFLVQLGVLPAPATP